MEKQTIQTGLAAVMIMIGGLACRQENSAQMIRRAQLVGDENLRLKKELQQKDARLVSLERQLEQTRQKKQELQERSDQLAEKTQQMEDENASLKKETQQKSVEIAELQQQVNLMDEKNMRTQEHKMIVSLMEILAECGNKLAKYEPVEALPVIPFSVADANEPAQQK